MAEDTPNLGEPPTHGDIAERKRTIRRRAALTFYVAMFMFLASCAVFMRYWLDADPSPVAVRVLMVVSGWIIVPAFGDAVMQRVKLRMKWSGKLSDMLLADFGRVKNGERIYTVHVRNPLVLLHIWRTGRQDDPFQVDGKMFRIVREALDEIFLKHEDRRDSPPTQVVVHATPIIEGGLLAALERSGCTKRRHGKAALNLLGFALLLGYSMLILSEMLLRGEVKWERVLARTWYRSPSRLKLTEMKQALRHQRSLADNEDAASSSNDV